MFCSNCGENLNKEDKFCSKCGIEVIKRNSINQDELEKTEINGSKNTREDKIEKEPNNKEVAFGYGVIIVVGVIIIFMFNSCISNSSVRPLPSDPNDMTNKEMEQFIEWKLKDNQREYDNRKFNE